MNIEIRDAKPSDQSVVADFNARMAEETEGQVLAPDVIGPGVTALLADPAKGRYWLALVDGEVAGQIMNTYEWSDWRNGVLWWIQSVYVASPHRRKGVFSAMYKHVESQAMADDEVCGLRLYVDKSNSRAQETYRILDMKETGYMVMESIFATEGET